MTDREIYEAYKREHVRQMRPTKFFALGALSLLLLFALVVTREVIVQIIIATLLLLILAVAIPETLRSRQQDET